MAHISTYPKASTFPNIPVLGKTKSKDNIKTKSLPEQICKALRSSGVDSFSRGLAVWTEWLCFRTHVTSSYIEIINGECPPRTKSDLMICVRDKSLQDVTPILWFSVPPRCEHPLRIHMVTICETELMHKLADPTRHAMFLVSVLNVIEPGNVQLHRLGIFPWSPCDLPCYCINMWIYIYVHVLRCLHVSSCFC